jgi:hypothetical protein
MRRLALLIAALALLVAAPAANAAGQQQRDGKLSLTFLNGLTAKGKKYLTQGQIVKVRGRAKPYVAGQRVTVRVTRNGGKKVKTKTLRLKKVKGRNAGEFKLRFEPGAKGMYKVTAVHKRTRAQKRFSATERRKVVDNTASYGSRGIRVRLLQKGLRKLGYGGIGIHGYYGPGTARAVLAFRKVNGLGRASIATTEVFKRVFQGRGTFRLKYPNSGKGGKHVEADLSRQVLVLAKGGKAVKIYHTSSGKPSTPTVLGSFRFYRKDAGTNGVGMVHSSYFIRGYAIHGYHSVPNYAASHGCLRVPIPNAWSIYSWVDLGDPIHVYR